MSVMASTASQRASITPMLFPQMTLKSQNKVQKVNLTFRESLTKRTGKGLHAEDAIMAGNLALRIKKPLLNIVKKGYIDSTCDNCMATKRDGGAMEGSCFNTINSDGISSPQHMVVCDGCNFLHYCSQKCKNEAWANHHRAECSILKEAASACHVDAECEIVRAALRLLCLRASGETYEQVLQDLLSLEELRPDDFNDLVFEVAGIIRFLQRYGLVEKYHQGPNFDRQEADTEGKRGEFQDIFLRMPTHGVDIAHPKINIDGCTEHHESYITAGTCFDFCTSKVNHSCAPNCIWVFNKSELQLRAVKDIPKGVELTVSYDAYRGSSEEEHDRGTVEEHWTGEAHEQRIRNLKNRWAFDCRCTLCVGEDFWPSKGSSIDKLVRPLFNEEGLASPESADEFGTLLMLLRTTTDQKFPLTSYPMKTIHERLREHEYDAQQLGNAFDRSLEIYFLVEPRYSIPITLDQRLTSLRNLSEYTNRYMRAVYGDDPPRRDKIFMFGLKLKLARDTAKCYGADSDIAIFLKTTFDAEIKATKRPELDIGEIEMSFPREMGRKLEEIGFNTRQILEAKISQML